MSKPMTKNQIATIKANANGNETVLALLAEVERFQKLAKPNRKPKTRKVVRHVNTTSPVIYANYNGGSEAYRNPDFGKVCPCKDCESKVSNENCSRNAKGCRCRITDNACKAFDYYDGRQG